jgi:hypothetical protein
MTHDFEAVFARLKDLLATYEPQLVLEHDTAGNYYLNAPVLGPNQKPLFFGAVQVKKHYVSYYLMPVYLYPDLLDDISPGLKKRMQGKSCFNFKAVDEDLFAELAGLTRRGFERLRKEYLS